MSAAPCRVLAFAALAAALPSPALASPYSDAVETAVFELCPGLRNGQISPERPTSLTRAGFRRTPEVEEDEADAEDGVPFLFARGAGAEAVTVGYWPVIDSCSVRFSGEQSAAAVAQVKARLAREARRFRRYAAGDRSWDFGRRETWRVVRGARSCLSIETPGRQGDPLSYNVSYEPLIPLQPQMFIASCAPAQSGVSATAGAFWDPQSQRPPAMIKAAPPKVAASGASPNRAQPRPAATSSWT